jgi:hypothetical protein
MIEKQFRIEKNSDLVVSKYPSFFVVAVLASSGTSTFTGIHTKPY